MKAKLITKASKQLSVEINEEVRQEDPEDGEDIIRKLRSDSKSMQKSK